jgi:hypothetical protein
LREKLRENSSINTHGGLFDVVRYEQQKLINKGRRREFSGMSEREPRQVLGRNRAFKTTIS